MSTTESTRCGYTWTTDRGDTALCDGRPHERGDHLDMVMTRRYGHTVRYANVPSRPAR